MRQSKAKAKSGHHETLTKMTREYPIIHELMREFVQPPLKVTTGMKDCLPVVCRTPKRAGKKINWGD